MSVWFPDSTPYKCPCRAATTANITLNGLQTIDGITVAEDDRVLVKDQTDAKDNGIYEAATGNWQRTMDFSDNREVVKGTQVYVTDGTQNGACTFVVTSDHTPHVFDADEIEFTLFVDVNSRLETPPSTNTYVPASGSVVDQYVVDVGNAKNVRAVPGEFDIPGISPLPPAGQMFLMSRYADSTVGNISNLYAVAWNSGTRYTAAITGIGAAPAGSTDTNIFGGQFSAVAAGNAGGIFQGANIEVDHGNGAVTSIALTLKIGDSGTGGSNPGNAYISALADTGRAPLYGWKLQASSTNPIATTGAIIGIEGSNLSAAYGINLTSGSFSTAAFKSTAFRVDGSGFLTARGVGLGDDASLTHEISLRQTGTLTASRNLTWNVNDASRAISLAGDLTLAGSLATSGANALTLTTTGTTNITLPTSGTLAALGGTNTWSGVNTFSNSTEASSGAGAIVTSGGIYAAKKIYTDSSIRMAAGAGFVIGSTTVLDVAGNLTLFRSPSDLTRLKLGNASDANNYYLNDSHNFRNAADAAALATINSTGLLLPSGAVIQVNSTQVVGPRDTGWTAMTGTANENTSYDTATVTLAQLAGRVMALQAALTTHGLIGA